MAHPDPVNALSALLGQHARPGGPVTAADAWEAFVAFARMDLAVPDVPDSDGLLYQFGGYAFSGRPMFHLDLVRQLAVEDDDEYVQVHLELRYVQTDELRALGHHDEWYFRGEPQTLDAWTTAVRSRPEWHVLAERGAETVEIFRDET